MPPDGRDCQSTANPPEDRIVYESSDRIKDELIMIDIMEQGIYFITDLVKYCR
jgi:hypothetical protein